MAVLICWKGQYYKNYLRNCCITFTKHYAPSLFTFISASHNIYLDYMFNWNKKCFMTVNNVPSKFKSVSDVAEFIVNNDPLNVLIMAGAGMSTPSGIPDFRTPGSGLYDNLQKYDLPYPEAIFDIHYFMMNPLPFFSLALDLYPGFKYKPNVAHYFLKVLSDENKLQKVYTQNIDVAGVPEKQLMEAHGTFATASCTLCGERYDGSIVRNAILEGNIPIYCSAKKCKGKIKPDIVFFGEMLPASFWDYQQEVVFSNLLIVIGTSLEVYPFAGIADSIGKSVPRVLINNASVGSFGSRQNDLVLEGNLEEIIHKLVDLLGWTNKVQLLMEK